MSEASVITNHRLAHCIRDVERLQEASYDPGLGATTREGRTGGEYTKTYLVCIDEIVGDDPIWMILACLFTAGYCEIFDFCNVILGKEK